MNDELEEWMLANKYTDIAWTEEEIYEEFKKANTQTSSDWCILMMAGVLGNMDAVRLKYPEMMI